MKKLIFVLLMITMSAIFAAAQVDMTVPSGTTVTHDARLGGHDIAIYYNGAAHTMGCKSCHAPHNGARFYARGYDATAGTIEDPGTVWNTAVPTSSGGRQQRFEVGQYKLWDKYLPATGFATYSSDKVTSNPLVTNAASTDTQWHSFLCLSCHDGATGSQNIPGGASGGMNITNRTINGNTDVGLLNDHPINVAWPAGTDYVAAGTVSTTFPLYSTQNFIQCSTCHNPHDEGTSAFLRMPYGEGGDYLQFCRTCHVK